MSISNGWIFCLDGQLSEFLAVLGWLKNTCRLIREATLFNRMVFFRPEPIRPLVIQFLQAVDALSCLHGKHLLRFVCQQSPAVFFARIKI